MCTSKTRMHYPMRGNDIDREKTNERVCAMPRCPAFGKVHHFLRQALHLHRAAVGSWATTRRPVLVGMVLRIYTYRYGYVN